MRTSSCDAYLDFIRKLDAASHLERLARPPQQTAPSRLSEFTHRERRGLPRLAASVRDKSCFPATRLRKERAPRMSYRARGWTTDRISPPVRLRDRVRSTRRQPSARSPRVRWELFWAGNTGQSWWVACGCCVRTPRTAINQKGAVVGIEESTNLIIAFRRMVKSKGNSRQN
jgi:hypothetical protein